MDIPYRRSGRPSKKPDPELLIKLYSEHTATEIASMYGVKEGTVRSWVSRLRYQDAVAREELKE